MAYAWTGALRRLTCDGPKEVGRVVGLREAEHVDSRLIVAALELVPDPVDDIKEEEAK